MSDSNGFFLPPPPLALSLAVAHGLTSHHFDSIAMISDFVKKMYHRLVFQSLSSTRKGRSAGPPN